MAPSNTITLSTPRSTPFGVGAIGAVFFGIGLYLVLVGLPRNYPISLNGWAFLIPGAFFFCFGMYAFLIHSPYLILDESGLHLPKYKLSIAWNEIKAAREAASETVPRVVVLSVTDDQKFAAFAAHIKKLIPDINGLGADEIPIPLVGRPAEAEAVVEALRKIEGMKKSSESR